MQQSARALVRAKVKELGVEQQVTGSPPSLLAAHRREKAKIKKAYAECTVTKLTEPETVTESD